MSNSKLLRGTFILTIATLISKILGFIYVVPFTALVGTSGYILFEYAYKPYVLMLSVATMGVPLAVSKFVSKYNELGDTETTKRLFRSGIYIMSATGVLSFALLYATAEPIAKILIDPSDTSGNRVEDVVYVIRAVSFALLIVPVMALIRGYYQGHQQMTPTAVSQVLEQILRIVLILGGSFYVLKIAKGDVFEAVGISTFGACFGAIGGFIILFLYLPKFRKPLTSDAAPPLSYGTIYKEVFSYAVPFVIVGLAIPFYQTIDTFMLNRTLMSVGQSLAQAELTNSLVSLNQKIILIPVSLATAFSITLVPAITRSNASNDIESMRNQMNQTYISLSLITLPAVFGIIALAHPIFVALFGSTDSVVGSQLMVWYAGTAIVYSLYSVSAAILQGLDEQKVAIISLMVGLAIKLALNSPFITWFGGAGTAWTTYIGFGISILINMYWINKRTGYKVSPIARTVIKTVVISAIMAGVVVATDAMLSHIMNSTGGYLSFLIRVVVGCGIGGSVYLFIIVNLNLHTLLLGNRLSFLGRLKVIRTSK